MTTLKTLGKLGALSLLASLAFGQNAALMPVPRIQFLDQNGFPLAGGLVFTCQSGASCPGTPLASYTDSSAGTANSNPVVLDASGSANIWLGNSSYKITLQNSAGVTQWTQDNVTAGALALSGSLAGANGATLIKFTPAATGGQTRTLAAIHGDTINAANYDTITHAFADACSSTPAKAVEIPASISATQTYTNSCSAAVVDWRYGTTSLPGTSRTFASPVFGGTVYDGSPQTSNVLAQGDSHHAPLILARVFETGAADATPIYSEYHCYAGCTGGAYGEALNLGADAGSAPGGMAFNWTLNDASHLWITGCTRTSNSATCTLYSGGGSPALNLGGGTSGCFYVTGTLDSTFTATGLVQCGTIGSGGYSVTFANTGANTSIGAGGWIAPAHQVFGFELNWNNAAHDPGNVGPDAGLPLPFWGIEMTNTPFTWTNPTGGASIVNLPITAAFFANGGSDKTQSGAQYNGFIAADAINDMFVGGNPQTGGSISLAKSAFRARPIAIARTGTNYASQKSCWDDSVQNGTGHLEVSYCVNFRPLTSANLSAGGLTFGQEGASNTIQFSNTGHILADSGTSSDVSYGFSGWTNGLYNASGVTTNVGAFAATGTINAAGGFGVNATAGATVTVACTAGQHISGITVVGGIITAVGACN